MTQARKAMFALLANAKSLKLPTDFTCELFERTVTPVLLYGCEIWGPSDIKDIEIFHRSFLCILLKTFKFTPNCMLYGETGVTNMNTCINSRKINFWAKLKFGDQSKISSTMYHLLAKLHHDQPDVFNFRWTDHVKIILDNTGFSEIWYAESIDEEKFKSCFKQRCIDIYKQDWCSDVQLTVNLPYTKFLKKLVNSKII